MPRQGGDYSNGSRSGAEWQSISKYNGKDSEDIAIKEIEENIILTDYLIARNLSFDDIDNFTDQKVRQATKWDRQGRPTQDEEARVKQALKVENALLKKEKEEKLRVQRQNNPASFLLYKFIREFDIPTGDDASEKQPEAD